MWRYALLLTPFAFGACALLVDTTGLQGDAGSPSDAGDAAAGNLLANGDFEQGTAACGPGWSPSNGTMSRSTTAHSGSFSCEVCPTSSKTVSLSATPSPSVSIVAGASFYAQVWVMLEGTSTSEVRIDVEELVSGGRTLVYQKGNATSTSWQLIQANTGGVVAGGTGMTFTITDVGKDGGVPSCVLVDDAQLMAQ